MDKNPEGDFSASVEHAELRTHSDQYQGAELDPQQRRNRLSGLKKYQDSFGRADTDPIDPEFNGQFEQRRAAFLPLRLGTGWSDPVPGWDLHPLSTSAFHGAHEQTLEKQHTPPCPAGSYFLCIFSRSSQWN